MLYSKTSQYAIRALNYLASLEGARPATIMEVNAKTGVPQAYVAKIFQCLCKAKIVASKSGPHGGYALRMDPKKLTLLHIIKSLDDISESPLSNCVMGQAECNDKNPCCLHGAWVKARGEMNRILSKETISDTCKLTKRVYKRSARQSTLSKSMQKVFGY